MAAFQKMQGSPAQKTMADIPSMAWQDIKKLGSGIVSSTKEALALPGEVASGKFNVQPSTPGMWSDEDEARQQIMERQKVERAVGLAVLATPLPAAMRAGERVIPGVAKATAVEKPAIPSAQAIDEAATGGFNTAKDFAKNDVRIDPVALRPVADKIEQSLQNKGILEEHAPTTYKTLERLRSAPEGSFSTVSDLHNTRQAFGNAAGSITHPKDTFAGKMGIDELDKFLSAIPEKAVLAGDAPAASAMLKDAIGNSAASFRVEDVGARLTRAERQAAKAGTGSNIDNAIRQKISAILDSKTGTRGYTPAEIAQMEKIVRGTTATNTLRKVGKLGFGDGLSLLLHAGATIPSGGANIPIGIAGTLARKVGEKLTQREANKLDEMIRARSPLAKSQTDTIRGLTGGEDAKRAAIVRALLSSQHQ